MMLSANWKWLICVFSFCWLLTIDFILRWTMRLHFLPLSINEAQISLVWTLPFCTEDVIWSQSLCCSDGGGGGGGKTQYSGVSNTHAQPITNLSCQSWCVTPLLYHQIKTTLPGKIKKRLFEQSLRKKCRFTFWLCSLGHVLSSNIEEAGFIIYTAASHKGQSRHFGSTSGEQ